MITPISAVIGRLCRSAWLAAALAAVIASGAEWYNLEIRP